MTDPLTPEEIEAYRIYVARVKAANAIYRAIEDNAATALAAAREARRLAQINHDAAVATAERDHHAAREAAGRDLLAALGVLTVDRSTP